MSFFPDFGGDRAKARPQRQTGRPAKRKRFIFRGKRRNSLHTLQVPDAPGTDGTPGGPDGKRASPAASSKKTSPASLTVEAALAMAVFLFAVTALLNFFFVLRVQIQVQTALEQTGNQLSALPEEASLVTASLLFRTHLEAEGADGSQITGGWEGISLARSSVMGREPVIDLVAEYQVDLPFFPEGLARLRLLQRSRKHAFGNAVFLSDGEESSGSEEAGEGYVYITPHGEVYHESMFCTYIRPVKESVALEELASRRNRNGEKYGACRFCGTGSPPSRVWITAWGDCYHQSEYCRGLWHDVRQVPRSEVEGRRACSKCGKESGG